MSLAFAEGDIRMWAEFHGAAEPLPALPVEPARDWLVWSNKWGLWHCEGFRGYTADVSRAGRFTHAEAMSYHDAAPRLRKHGNEARHVSAVRGTIEAAIEAKMVECAAAVERLRGHLASLPA